MKCPERNNEATRVGKSWVCKQQWPLTLGRLAALWHIFLHNGYIENEGLQSRNCHRAMRVSYTGRASFREE